MNQVTRILSAIEQGDPSAGAQLLPLVYDELRRLAAQKMSREMPDQTLQATALVHEAYLRLVDTEKVQHWNGRAHFLRTRRFIRRGRCSRKPPSGPEPWWRTRLRMIPARPAALPDRHRLFPIPILAAIRPMER